jgi:hypothetical protein
MDLNLARERKGCLKAGKLVALLLMQCWARHFGVIATGARGIGSVEAFCQVLAHRPHFYSMGAQPLNLTRGFLC